MTITLRSREADPLRRIQHEFGQRIPQLLAKGKTVKCSKCGADVPSNLPSNLCPSCLAGRQRNQNIKVIAGLLAGIGIPTLIVFGAIHACSRLYPSDSSVAVSVNDYADATDDIWCMDSKESLDKLVDLAAKNAYDEMNELFLSSGVTTLRKGQSVKVIDESFSGFRVRTLGGQECWVTSNMLTKEEAPSSEAPNQSSSATPGPEQKGTPDQAFKLAPGEEMIGEWQGASEGWAYAIVKSNGTYYWDAVRPTGSDSGRQELKVVDSAKGRKYMLVGDPAGLYYVIAKDGSLRVYDRDGFVNSGQKMQK